MSANAPAGTVTDPLYAAMLALAGDALLVPNSVLAGVVTGDRPLSGTQSGGLLGMLDWHGSAIHVVSFEGLNGQPVSNVHGRHERFVVVHAFGTGLPARAWALRSTSHPRVIPLSADVLQPMPLRSTDRPGLILARTRIGEREMAIPDLEHIEAQLASA